MNKENANPPLSPKDDGDKTEKAKLVYEKPKLRTYDQIDQVRPYGPSTK